MKARRRSTKGPALSRKSRQALDRFERFAAATIAQLERGEPMVVFLHVARGVDDCPKGPPPASGSSLYVSFQSQMIKGPPYYVQES